MASRFPEIARRGLVCLCSAAAAWVTPAAAAYELGGVYGLVLQSHLETRDGVPLGGLELTGRVSLTPASFSLDQLQCAPKPTSRSQHAARAVAETCQLLQGTHRWRLDPDGRLRELQIPTESSLTAEGVLKYLAAAIQFTRGEGNAWAASEYDTMGEYRADYSRQGNRSTRNKVRYLRAAGSEALRTPLAGEFQVRSRTTFTWGADRRLDSLQLDERTARLGAHLSLPDATYVARLTLIREDEAAASADEARARKADGAWVAPYAPPSERARSRAADRARIGAAGYADLVAILNQAPPLRADTDAQKEARKQFDLAYLSLVALLRQSTAARQQATIDCSGPQPQCRVLITALGAAGTELTQEVLASIFAALAPAPERNPPDTLERAQLRREAIRALGTRSGGPLSDATRRLLVSLLDDATVGKQAAYGLGAEAYRRRGQRDVTPYIRPLLDRLHGPRHQRLFMFGALGNAGAPETLTTASAIVRDRDPLLAAAAVESLRRVPMSTQLEQVLLAALADTRPQVTRAALSVVARRHDHTDALATQVAILAGHGPVADIAARVLERWEQAGEPGP